jgi:hypothetical protein
VKIIGEGPERPDRVCVAIRANGRDVHGGTNIDCRRRGMNRGQIPPRTGSFSVRHVSYRGKLKIRVKIGHKGVGRHYPNDYNGLFVRLSAVHRPAGAMAFGRPPGCPEMGSPATSGKTRISNGIQNVLRRPQRSTFLDTAQHQRRLGL